MGLAAELLQLVSDDAAARTRFLASWATALPAQGSQPSSLTWRAALLDILMEAFREQQEAIASALLRHPARAAQPVAQGPVVGLTGGCGCTLGGNLRFFKDRKSVVLGVWAAPPFRWSRGPGPHLFEGSPGPPGLPSPPNNRFPTLKKSRDFIGPQSAATRLGRRRGALRGAGWRVVAASQAGCRRSPRTRARGSCRWAGSFTRT